MSEVVARFSLENNPLNARYTLSDGSEVDAIFKIDAAGTTWGSIDGTLSNQTDLQAALDLKADKTELDADIAEVNSTISDLESVVNNNYTTLDNKIDGVESDLLGDISALSQTVEDNNTAVNNRIDETNDTVSDLSDTVTSNYNTLDNKIDSEISNRTSADATLQNNINTLSQTVTDNNTAINDRVDGVVSAFDDEIESLSDTVSDNYTDLDDKISDLTDTVNDNDTAINSKVNGINTTLTTSINNLSNTVSSNYTTLDTKIDNTKTSLEGDISDLSDTVSQNYTDLSNAITTSASTINSRIDNEVSTLNTAIGTETTSRQNADNNLQSQIDAIVSSSDVFDIVGTYAELQAYDISTVPVNDIIKVLVDSSHDNAATYYRCVETAGVKSWSYIGSEGAYYTKSESDTKFVAKTTTINNIPLSNNITLTASDVNALSDTTVIGDGVLTLQKNGVNIDTFNANATANKSINITVPTDTSDLTNGAGFITAASLPTVNNGTLTIQANGTTVGTFTANQAGNTTANIVVPDSATWGNITGTLSNQTDLQSALNDKYDASNPDGFISGITSSDVIAALGYTPYNATNPNNYITASALTGYATEQWVSNQNYVNSTTLATTLADYQPLLVSGTNIKTINNTSILGSGNITIQSAPDIDEISITTNSDDELQTVGVIDQNNNTNAIKTWTGTKAQYDAIVTKDSNTLYNIIDDSDVTFALLELLFPIGAVYFGTMSVCPLEILGVGTWQSLPQDKVIQIAGTRGSVGDTLNESLPTPSHTHTRGNMNITGTIACKGGGWNDGTQTGAFTISNSKLINAQSSGDYNCGLINFNASRNWTGSTSQPNGLPNVYQNDAPVQQDAYLLNGWRRIA